MRHPDPLIIGAGPAGCAAAIALAQRGGRALMLEAAAATGDALCGGFLSWRSCDSLDRLGIDRAALGGHRVTKVTLFSGQRRASASLPRAGLGISRHQLDTQLLARAVALGSGLERGQRLTEVDPDGTLRFADATQLNPATAFIATGKHNVRGLVRVPARDDRDPAAGLRLRLAPHPALTALIGDAIELHLFDGGYAGLLLQEDGSANLCLALRKSRLREAGGDPEALLAALAADHPALGERLHFASAAPQIDAIAAIPYGWRTAQTRPGRFLLGDQAVCIPSLAGEGNGLALASGLRAAAAWHAGGEAAAPTFQHDFARATRRPVSVAMQLWHWCERPMGARLAIAAIGVAPGLARLAARLTRIAD